MFGVHILDIQHDNGIRGYSSMKVLMKMCFRENVRLGNIIVKFLSGNHLLEKCMAIFLTNSQRQRIELKIYQCHKSIYKDYFHVCRIRRKMDDHFISICMKYKYI